ncbi:MAG: NAD(P)H-dependent oxidoreductase [Ferruginibacter sp.]
MITIISASNRDDNNTLKVSREYERILQEKNITVQVLSLAERAVFQRDEEFLKMEKNFLIGADSFIIIMPEYHGSYPGILKLMIDNADVKNCFWHKKVLLTGVSTGRAGNLRGMEHLTGSLLHMKMKVHFNRLPLSRVDTLMDNDNHFTDAPTLNIIEQQLDEFLAF